MSKPTEYDRVIVKLFDDLYDPKTSYVEFTKDQITQVCLAQNINVRNVPDIIYTYRYRSSLPEAITGRGNWVIIGKGKGKYAFQKLSRSPYITFQADLETIPIPDATPGVVVKHAGTDEQSMLAKVRYNRLVDIFLSIVTFHLQGHFRTFIQEVGQLEIDDLYVGIDAEGREYTIPVGAKGADPREKVGITHVSDLIHFGKQNFPNLVLCPVTVKEWEDGSIFMVLFNTADDLEKIQIKSQKRYKLVQVKKPS